MKNMKMALKWRDNMTIFQRRHYVLMSKLVAEYVNQVCISLKRDNPNFDEERFREAIEENMKR